MKHLNSKTPLNLKRQVCAYCKAKFLPNRRWIQKYCSESCRVMACKERKNGLAGKLKDKARSLSVTDLGNIQLNSYNEIMQQMMQMFADIKYLREDINDIQKSQNPESIKSIEKLVTDWDNKGISAIPSQMKSFDSKLFQMELKMELLLNNQSSQKWIALISSVVGPILGQKLWAGGIEEVVTGKKSMSIEDKLVEITEILNNN